MSEMSDTTVQNDQVSPERYSEDQLKSAIDAGNALVASYKRFTVITPLLFAAIAAAIGVATGSWWHVVVYALIVVYFELTWRRKSSEILAAVDEMRDCLEGRSPGLSEKAHKTYLICSAPGKALGFGIVALGILFVVLTGLGTFVISTAYDRIFDLPTLLVGLFMLVLSVLPCVPMLQFLVLFTASRRS